MDTEQLITTLLASMNAGRLIVLAGAGVSFAIPSNTPSAARVAQEAYTRHHHLTGEQLPPDFEWDLERVARHFFASGMFPYFLSTLVDWKPFRAEPNRGHFSIADFLACGAVDLAITTNFDTLVEAAAARIGEPDFQAALHGGEANQAAAHRPYLKVYGCCLKDRANTLWCVEQVTTAPLAERLANSATFLAGRLLNRDLLVIGFWSDWKYLNSILENALPPRSGANIYLVDPESDDMLREKAPGLWAWAEQHQHFSHVTARAEDVLEELRSRFSRLLLRRVMKRAGDATDVTWLEGLSTDDAYAIRRDLAGVNEVARHLSDDAAMTAFARMHSELNSRGAAFEQGRYSIGERRVRVIQAAGRMLSDVRAEFGITPTLSDDVDIVLCAAAGEDGDATPNIIRDESVATIIRGGSSTLRFLTTIEQLFDEEDL